MKTEKIMRKGDFLELWDSLVPTVMKNNFRKDVDKLIQQSTASHLEELLKLRSQNETLKQQVGEGWKLPIGDNLHKTRNGRVVLLSIAIPIANRFKTHPEKVTEVVEQIINNINKLPKPYQPQERTGP